MFLRKGFTLIELLVVIAIIAVLAAILFPVFAKAREKARMTTCLSNQKQIATAALMYAQDYNGLFPAFSTAWAGEMKLDNGVFDCPSITGTGSAAKPDYAFNACLCGTSQTQMGDASSLVLTTDIERVGDTNRYLLDPVQEVATPHGGAVVAFADGHAAFAPKANDGNGFQAICVRAGGQFVPQGNALGAAIQGSFNSTHNAAGYYTVTGGTPLWDMPTELVYSGSTMPNFSAEFTLRAYWSGSAGRQAGTRGVGVYLPATADTSGAQGVYGGYFDTSPSLAPTVMQGVAGVCTNRGPVSGVKVPWGGDQGATNEVWYTLKLGVCYGTVYAIAFDNKGVPFAANAAKLTSQATYAGRTKWSPVASGGNYCYVKKVQWYAIFNGTQME
jgi:prepilin-type N-terminal cleavage/methylation domain-containing protein/prepilin-type processing-associated H-X9-DG protein